MKKIAFLILFVALFACKQNNVTIQKEYYENRALKAEAEVSDGKMNGFYKEYFPSGELKIIASFKDDKQHGKTKVFFENGNIEREVYFTNGVQQDTAKFYYENGKLKEVSIIKDGEKNGAYKEFYKNGNIKYVGQLKNETPFGFWKKYDTQGNFIDSATFEQLSKLDNNQSLNLNIHSNKKAGYSIKYPAKWDIVTDYKGASFIAKNPHVNKHTGFSESINVLISEAKKNKGVAEIAETDIHELRNNYKSFKLIAKETSKINSLNAIIIKYQIEMNNQEVVVITSYINGENNFYLITCLTTHEEQFAFKAMFNTIIHSFTEINKISL